MAIAQKIEPTASVKIKIYPRIQGHAALETPTSGAKKAKFVFTIRTDPACLSHERHDALQIYKIQKPDDFFNTDEWTPLPPRQTKHVITLGKIFVSAVCQIYEC